MPTTRPAADQDLMFQKLQAQLLRSCRPAVRRLCRAARGRSDFSNQLELSACLGLARIVGDLLYRRTETPRHNAQSAQALRSLNRLLGGCDRNGGAS